MIQSISTLAQQNFGSFTTKDEFNFKQLESECLSEGIDIKKCMPIAAGDFLARQFEPRVSILGELLTTQMIANITAPSGLGKSWCAMAVSSAITTGGEFMGYEAPQARKVCYLDAEMPAVDMQSRMRCLMNGLTAPQKELFCSNFYVVNTALIGQDLPDLTTELGQKMVQQFVKTAGADVLVIDNLISVFTEADDQDPEAMKKFTNWLRELRSSGLTVITINHTTKEGKRLGSVLLDTYNDLILDIREPKKDSKTKNDPPKNYINMIFSKARHLNSEQKKTIAFQFNVTDFGVQYQRVAPNPNE